MLFEDTDISEEEKIKQYIEFLVERGYIIIPPNSIKHPSITGPEMLVEYFYTLLKYFNRDRKIHYTRATKKDLHLASLFIKTRKEDMGCSLKRALEECAEIVRCVVEHESVFQLTEPVHSFDVFGQDSCKWVTDRAISIINRENYIKERDDLGLFMDALCEKQEKESYEHIDKHVEILKDFLGGLEDGKKE